MTVGNIAVITALHQPLPCNLLNKDSIGHDKIKSDAALLGIFGFVSTRGTWPYVHSTPELNIVQCDRQ
jgi:hypothetical protein